MTPNEAVERAVPIFAKYPEIGFAELREMLRHEGGLSHEDIDQILEFVPLAFGRGLLGDSVTFADEYVRTDVEGRERMRKKLADEPFFREAAMYAPLVMMKLGRDAFSAIALRSSEVRAINDALNAGSDLSDLVAAPPVLYWKDPGPGETAPSYQRQQAPPASAGRKPWWKLWTLAFAVLLCSREVFACAPAPHAGERIVTVEESAVIIWEPATRTQHFIRRATFQGQARDFGFLVPTPTQPALARADDGVFRHLQEKTTPPTVYEKETKIAWMPLLGVPFMMRKGNDEIATTAARPPVEVLSTQKVAGYEAAILDATDAAALNAWLGEHGYATTPELTEWLDAYVKQRWIISAFKIDKTQDDSAQTSAVRMSFTTDRPFFPYREPASQREGVNESRLLRVFFVGPERVTGRIGSDVPWPGQMHWSDAVRDLELAGVKLSGKERLTAFEDFSSPRPGTDDLFFVTDPDQKTIVPPPIVLPDTRTIWLPPDVIAGLILIGFGVRRFYRRFQSGGKPPHSTSDE